MKIRIDHETRRARRILPDGNELAIAYQEALWLVNTGRGYEV